MMFKNSWKWLVALGAVFVPASLMAAVTIPNTFTAGTTIVAADMNANFAAIKTFVDGLETTVNGKANAAATGTQYTNTPNGKSVYAWSGSCHTSTTANCAVNATYSYNAGGAAITSTRSAAGVYNVTFPGLATTAGGNVQVTAYGNNTNNCKVVSWGNTNVNIRCYTSAGVNQDTQWTVLVTR
ncbi:MAG TPA: hypothetical protein PKA88_05635 [Polyangiaceae bacterium]|nr:hypothetical protein [Polyangiaceae bacterium]HMR76121.1 hypothetical protein [Polyangiaceae bacterium]